MKKKLFLLAFIGIGMLILAIVALYICNSIDWSMFFVIIFLVCLGIFTYHYIKLYNIQLGEKVIIRHGGECFHYSEVKGIAIYKAVDWRENGPKDKNGNPKALVSLYLSPTSFITRVGANSRGFTLNEDYYLGRIILDKEVLLTLFKKTKLPVFITEEMMKLYYESYADIFEKYQFRVLIGCHQRTNDREREFISLAEFKKYHNM